MGKVKVMGVYQIKNKINGKRYIGSSIDIYHRWKSHIWDLRGNKHHSVHLQYAWDKYGENNFEFSIIEKVSAKEELLNREQYYLDLYLSYEEELGYNICKFSGNRLGFHHTEEAKEKIGKKQRGDLHHSSILTSSDVIEIKYLLKHSDLTLEEIGQHYKVGFQAISNVKREKTWGHLILDEGFVDIEKINDIYKKIKSDNIGKISSRKLNKENVIEIKKLLKEGKSNTSIAKIFNVTQTAISEIKTGKTWKHVKIN